MAKAYFISTWQQVSRHWFHAIAFDFRSFDKLIYANFMESAYAYGAICLHLSMLD
jgi:hypothetical protein